MSTPTAAPIEPGAVVIPYDKTKTAKKALAATAQAALTIVVVALGDAALSAIQDDPSLIGRMFAFAGVPAALILVAVPVVNGGIKFVVDYWGKRRGVLIPAVQTKQIVLAAVSANIIPTSPPLPVAWATRQMKGD